MAFNAPARRAPTVLLSFSLPARVDLSPMRHVDHDDDELVVLDVAQDSIVTNPIAPHTRKVAREGFSSASRVFELRYLRKLAPNPLRRLLVHFPKSAKRLLGDFNRPSQASHRPR